MRGSISNQAQQLWHRVDGIGQSKGANRSNSTIKGHNGHKVSDKVHSYRSKDEFIRISKELLSFSKQNFKIKDMQAITGEVVKAYIHQKIENGVMKNSLSTYISTLGKIQIGLLTIDKKLEKHDNLFSQKDLKSIRDQINKEAIKSIHINRAYINPTGFRSNIHTSSQIAFELQLKYGLRVSEATLIRANQLQKNNTIKIQGKGGYKRDVVVSPKLFNQIKQEIQKNGSYKRGYNDYIKDLKNAVSLAKETWTGTHGLRYNFAQTKMKEYEKSMSHKEALSTVSYELGHHRVEITYHYLK